MYRYCCYCYDYGYGYTTQRRNLVQEGIRANVEEEISKMVGQSRQGTWTRWENFVKRKISWLDIRHADVSRLKFQVQSVYDVLPSPVNLFSWGKDGMPSCPLCAGKCTLTHYECLPGHLAMGVIVGDTTRYLGRWPIQWTLQSARIAISWRRGRFTSSKPANAPPSACKINFICLLSTAQDWQWRVDIEKRLKVLEQITTTTLRPI